MIKVLSVTSECAARVVKTGGWPTGGRPARCAWRAGRGECGACCRLSKVMGRLRTGKRVLDDPGLFSAAPARVVGGGRVAGLDCWWLDAAHLFPGRDGAPYNHRTGRTGPRTPRALRALSWIAAEIGGGALARLAARHPVHCQRTGKRGLRRSNCGTAPDAPVGKRVMKPSTTSLFQGNRAGRQAPRAAPAPRA